MGITMYRGNVLLGKALGVVVEGEDVTISLGTIDRFEVMKYLSPRVARDLIGEKDVSAMPVLTLYCEPSSISGKKKNGHVLKAKVEEGVGHTKMSVQPTVIEVTPMPGQNLSLRYLKGKLVGAMDTGVEVPAEVEPMPLVETPTVLY